MQSLTTVEWQPRFGFAWTPPGLKNTVLRGGFGLFGDTFPGQIADSLATNPPLENTWTAAGPLSPAEAGNVFAATKALNAAFVAGFNAGGTVTSLGLTGAGPNIINATNIKSPMYEEWNLELQQGIGNATSVNLNYVGNHGYHETVQFNGINATDTIGTFVSLPAAPPDPRFSLVNQIRTVGVSNYNGLVVSVQHRFSHCLLLTSNNAHDFHSTTLIS